MEEGVDYEQARFIRASERDVALRLDELRWPSNRAVPNGWTPRKRWLERIILASDQKLMSGPLEEKVIRFPSAPIHGWQRLHEYHLSLDASLNFHTYRVLSRPGDSGRVARIFMMHNGLNEVNSMGLYYQIASHLVHSEPGTVCVVRPFPSHLSRFPFQNFGEKPLDRYLWDGSHLFRQFLRYMVETQWFLSAVVRRSSYRTLTGANLLGESETPACSRLEPRVLAKLMASAWRHLYHASKKARANGTTGSFTEMKPSIRGRGRYLDAIVSLREALRLEGYDWLSGRLAENDEEPTLHVVGYSLGGFTAQSVFMSWPFLIASCSTVLSGGALRELSPTAFAHPEEWQTVLHSLRYELDDALMDGRNGRDARHVAGMEKDLFLYLKRTFYEVFQQEYRGSFQSRLEAYLQRMLFVVGGNDPIVQTRSVLDSGPPGGINVLAIGGIGHFLEAKSPDDKEEEQRTFWLPEMSRLIHRFSTNAKTKHDNERPFTWLNQQMKFVAYPPTDRHEDDDEHNEADARRDAYKPRRLGAPERLAISQDGELPGTLFERCLDDLLARQDEGDRANGLLLILRNELPTMLLDDMGIYQRAAMLNHDDLSMARYVQGTRGRRDVLKRRIDRIGLVIPWNASRIMSSMDAHRGYPTQAEAPKGGLPSDPSTPQAVEPDDSWETAFKTGYELASGSPESIRVFDGRRPLREMPGLLLLAREQMHDPSLRRVASLPDCWIWMSRTFLGAGEDLITVKSGLDFLRANVPMHYKSKSAIDGLLRKEDLRIITVSRARYNPRFRGRMVVDRKAAREVLLHAVLCASSSVPCSQYNLQTGKRKRSRKRARSH